METPFHSSDEEGVVAYAQSSGPWEAVEVGQPDHGEDRPEGANHPRRWSRIRAHEGPDDRSLNDPDNGHHEKQGNPRHMSTWCHPRQPSAFSKRHSSIPISLGQLRTHQYVQAPECEDNARKRDGRIVHLFGCAASASIGLTDKVGCDRLRSCHDDSIGRAQERGWTTRQPGNASCCTSDSGLGQLVFPAANHLRCERC